MPLVEVLLGLIAVLVTITLTVVGALYRELIVNIKPSVHEIRHVLFGPPDDATDDGLVQDVAELDTTLTENAEERRVEHQQVDHQLNRLRARLDSVVSALQRTDDVDVRVTQAQESNREEDRNAK